MDHSTWHRALRHACELRLTDGTHQESRWYLNMVDPKVRKTAGLAWFTEMQSFMDWLDERVKAGLFEVMSFEKMLRMHGHGPLIDS
ncbi:MAG: hypothetical protein JXB42_13685 [Deltaproteobacteria bacterium]|nr:hypothetical protein [Deltaproteobacteria bacterium]